MKVSRMSTAAAATVAAATSCWLLSPAPARPTVAQAHAGGTHLLSQLPVAFVPNLGQWQHPARFVARIGAMTVFLEATGWTLACVERGAGKELPRLPAAAA